MRKLDQIFAACLALSCLFNFMKLRKGDAMLQGTSMDGVNPIPKVSSKFKVRNDTLAAMSEALDCLRQSKPNLPDLSYPDDALEHFNEIHRRLEKWVQEPQHKASGYAGPWLENRFITHFQKELESKKYVLPDVFGPYIPIFIPWTDLWVNNRFEYPSELVLTLMNSLRDGVMYITLAQSDEGLVAKCQEMDRVQERFDITILSSGGFGHVPIPLFKQPERLNNMIPIENRTHLISYVGSPTNAPGDMRAEMIAQNNHFYYKGEKWRQVMAESKFSLCPRGYGRTAYHVMETLQMGLIPIHVYIDQPWLPYGDIMNNISFSITKEELPKLISQLEKMPDSEIAQMEERIRKLRNDFFTYEGALERIGEFMIRPMNSTLKCQALPLDSGTGLIYSPCTSLPGVMNSN